MSNFKNLALSVIPMATNAHLWEERIDALLDAGVYNFDPAKARDLDSICTVEPMQCLVGYATSPSFLDPTYAATIKIAREKNPSTSIFCQWAAWHCYKE